MANITLKNVNKIYPNNVHAVFDFDLDIKDKEFIVFVGPSGCGKSTTLRMIAGLEEITSGEFYIDGKLMNYVQPKDRNVSMVFQNYALYPHMTVYRNMSYGLSIKVGDFPIYEKDQRVDDLVKLIAKQKKSLNNVLKKMAKDGDNGELKKTYNELFQSISDSLNEIMRIRKPIIGIDEARISKVSKEIEKIKKEIAFVDGLIKKEVDEQTNDEELIKIYKDDVMNFRNLLVDKEKELTDLKSGNSPILKYRHYYKYEIDAEVYHAAEILDLQPYLARFPSALSGGQRQRVALGRAIVRRPKVFLMDEPLSNLDAKLRAQTRGEILKLHKRVDATTIYVTHDQTEAMTLADRIVIMKDGYIQQIAKPMDAFNDPNNMFVAGFIGSPAMNFINGKIIDNKFVTDNKLISISLGKEFDDIVKKVGDKEVVLGIRPENISIVSSDGDATLDVDMTELLGTETIIYTKTNNETINIKISDQINGVLDSSLKVKFDTKKVYFFDKETTNRIR